MTTIRVVRAAQAKGSFELKERDIPSPGPARVRIKAQAYGIYHSDKLNIHLSPFPSIGLAKA